VNSQIATGGSAAGGGEGSNTGIGFAVPSNIARSVVGKLEKGQKVEHAYLGVGVRDASSGGGAVLGSVQGGGPADRAGLEAGDEIVAIDGDAVSGADELTSVVNSHQPGDRLALTYRRNGSEHHTDVTLGTRPARAPTG
jgi:S1-C subfamily serine protease